MKPSDPASQRYYEETFKPRLLQLLETRAEPWTVEFEEDPCETNLPRRTRVKTLSVSAILEYGNTSLLHSSVLIEGNNQLHDN